LQAREELDALKNERDELLDALADCIGQSCHVNENGLAYPHDLDSCALSAYADGLRLLAKYGKVEIKTDVGRRVIANWKK
jgi:hypothetical protein